jgi:hypothetical protein
LSDFDLRRNRIASRSAPRYPLLPLWVVLSVVVIGVFVLSAEPQTWLPGWIFAGYVAIIVATISCFREDHDPLSPFVALLGLYAIRFTIPALIPDSTLVRDPLFQSMGLTPLAWTNGEAIAVLGMSGLALGWRLGRGTNAEWHSIRAGFRQSLFWPSVLAAIVGLASTLIFVSSNASFGEAVLTGTFRGTAIQQGTGVFFYLGLTLIPGSVGLTFSLLAGHRSSVVGLLPVLGASALYLTLGGRARAATPLLVGIVVWWYMRLKQRSSVRNRTHSWFIVPISIAVGVCFLYVGALYRGGLGMHAFSASLDFSRLRQYLSTAILLDFGQLHALAGASIVGPGVLHGATFVGSLAWPLTQWLSLPGRSGGIYVLQMTTGNQFPSSALLPTLIGDAYLNFGIVATAVVPGILGLSLKRLYRGFREGEIALPTYALTAVYLVRIGSESIDKWPEALVVLGGWFLIQFAADLLPPRQTHTTGPREAITLVSGERRS